MNAKTSPVGLVHALILSGDGHSKDLAWDRLPAWRPDQGVLWIHFDFEDPAVQNWLEHESGLDSIACTALVSTETRPRSVNRGDHLLLTLRGINSNPGENPEDMVSLRIWTDGKRLISTRRRNLLSTQDVLTELDAGNGPRSATELLVVWIERITDRMNDTIGEFEDKVLAIEDRLLGDETQGVRMELSVLRKQIIAVRRYLAPQREAMNRLASENLTWLDELSRLKLREATDRLIRHIEDLDEIRDRAALAQEELANRVAEQLNARSYLFTVAAVIFLPLGFFTGLLGVNVGGMPGTDSPIAFWVVVGLCGLVAFALAVWFRARRWL